MPNFFKVLGSSDLFTIDPDALTAPTPKTLWIELTSKCPFDCVFCTRKMRFGAGRNLDFEIYRRVIAELDAPDFIGLNYSGESIYYPRLLDAIKLARSTQAFTELVSAFSTIGEPLLRGIVESGLDRLAISLHTMDADQYRRIYRLGSLDLLKQRIDDFLNIRSSLGLLKPRLDFCFVAMSENLDQLERVAEYAQAVGVPEIFVHPIIGRHFVPHDFPIELAGSKLRDPFREALRRTIESVRTNYPNLPITVLNADVGEAASLTPSPAYYAPSLSHNANIFSCDQSPFESVHILATGNVVACEVHDEKYLGNLNEQSLRDIWHGERYREFRRRYVANPLPECRDCVWKSAYLPGTWSSAIVVQRGMTPQLLRGWHAHEGNGTIWSKKQALLALKARKPARRLRIQGVLPPGRDGEPNCIAAVCNRLDVGNIRNASNDMMSFDVRFPLPGTSEFAYVDFTTAHLYRPALHSASNDARDLGFGLQRIEVS